MYTLYKTPSGERAIIHHNNIYLCLGDVIDAYKPDLDTINQRSAIHEKRKGRVQHVVRSTRNMGLEDQYLVRMPYKSRGLWFIRNDGVRICCCFYQHRAGKGISPKKFKKLCDLYENLTTNDLVAQK